MRVREKYATKVNIPKLTAEEVAQIIVQEPKIMQNLLNASKWLIINLWISSKTNWLILQDKNKLNIRVQKFGT